MAYARARISRPGKPVGQEADDDRYHEPGNHGCEEERSHPAAGIILCQIEDEPTLGGSKRPR